MVRLHIQCRDDRVAPLLDAPPDSTKENAAAAGTRSGAENDFERGSHSDKDTVSLLERHPIIALHWGIGA